MKVVISSPSPIFMALVSVRMWQDLGTGSATKGVGAATPQCLPGDIMTVLSANPGEAEPGGPPSLRAGMILA